MMRRLLLLCVVSGLWLSSASAGPIEWVKHHKRFLFMEGAAVAGAVIHHEGLSRCRRFGVERCDAHYGSAWGAYWFTTGLTTVAFPATAEGCWKSQQGKWCGLISYVPSSIQAGWGVHEWTIGKPHAVELN